MWSTGVFQAVARVLHVQQQWMDVDRRVTVRFVLGIAFEP